MSHETDTTLLGKNSAYPEVYAPEVLQPIPRLLGRQAIGLADSKLPFVGVDLWNAYEVSWLNDKGKPEVRLLLLSVPCDSDNIVESKSLKLYLGSFNQTRFSDQQMLKDTLKRDLEQVTGAQVTVALFQLDSAAVEFTIQQPSGTCLDSLDISCEEYRVTPTLLRAQAGESVAESVFSHLLRSRCPVTGQPDWATVRVEYEGQPIDHAGLLRYIVSFRDNQEFHEQCVERMFMDIMQHCKPTKLLIEARYTRRGGIDINPIRSSHEIKTGNSRLIRQ